MKKLKQNVWRLSLSMMWLVIVLLISCKSNKEVKPLESALPDSKDSLKTQVEPVKTDTLKKDTTAKVVVPKKKKKIIINTPKPTDPGPVCKYGVMIKTNLKEGE